MTRSGARDSFNLRFGVAKTPEQEQAYDPIYPMLVQLRDRAQAQGPNPMGGAQAPLPDPRMATSIFAGMDYRHVQGQPGGNPGAAPAPAPNPPGRPR